MSSMVIGLGADELKDLARFIEGLEDEKNDYGPELTGAIAVRLAGQEWGVALDYDRRGDGTYEVFLVRDLPVRAYILNKIESEGPE